MSTFTVSQFVQADCTLDNVLAAREVFVSWIAANAADLLPLLPTGSGPLRKGPYKDLTDEMKSEYIAAGRTTAAAKAAHRRTMNVVRIIASNPQRKGEGLPEYEARIISARTIANTDDPDQIAAAIAGTQSVVRRKPRTAAEKAAAEKAAAEKAAKAAAKAAEKAAKDEAAAAAKAAEDAAKAAEDAEQIAKDEASMEADGFSFGPRLERAHNALALALAEYAEALTRYREDEGGNLTKASAKWMTTALADAAKLIAAA